MSSPRHDKGRKKHAVGDGYAYDRAPIDGVADMTDEEFWSHSDEYFESRRQSNPDRDAWRRGVLHVPNQ